MDLWSQMPKDLLQQIAGHLDTQFDLLRFRSVCASWRSSIPPNPNNYLQHRFSVLPNSGITRASLGFYLSKRTIFLIGSPQSRDQTPWLIKINQRKSQRLTLLNPIARHPFLTLPENFPKKLDLLNVRVLELGQEHVLQYINTRHPRTVFGDPSTLYMEKIAFLNLGCGDFYESNDFVLLTIHVSGKLALLRSGDKEWSIIHDMPSPYDDVIMFKGRFYAVDSSGRTVIVGLNLSTSLVGSAVFGGDKKYLVESIGELLLVDTYLSVDMEEGDRDEEEFRLEDVFDCCISERTVRFKVYKLDDRGGKQWIEVRDLGDRVLFLGCDSTFSASFRDLGLCKGNFIFFADNIFQLNRVEDSMLKGHDVGVFDLESGRIGSLDNHPVYSKLFWPPPDWLVASRISEVNNQLESLEL